MFDRIYIEEEVREHPRSKAVLDRHPKAELIFCRRYGEIFNPKRQDFRLQKAKPSLILAAKHGRRTLPTPPGYGLGADQHHYFSHMYNCLYDCRYCFLQGMYQSANYVLFVNFEDFEAEIASITAERPEESHFFFSGYDCDSLAMESLTGFAQTFVPFFRNLPNACLELRTKSASVRSLLSHDATSNIVVAYSLNPTPVAQSLERRAPSLERRLDAIGKLSNAGWPIGLRFDPLIDFAGCEEAYRSFFDEVFARVPNGSIHSVTLGTFRSPKRVFQKMKAHYPEEPLFKSFLARAGNSVGYRDDVERALIEASQEQILKRVPLERFFPCY